MHDNDMTSFERSLATRLRAHSDIEVSPSNALAEARQAMATRRRAGFAASWASLRPAMRTAIVLALLGALLTGVVAVGSRLLWPTLTVTTPSAPTPLASSAPPDRIATLEGEWIAAMPDNLAVGGTGAPATLSLVIDAGGTHATVKIAPSEQVRLFADVEPVADGLRLIAKAPSDPVVSDGITFAGCPAGDAATYDWSRSADGLSLTLSAAAEDCTARGAMLSRTWIHSLGAPNSGGLGVVDAIDQLFTVTLPSGSYEVERRPGAITIVQTVPERQFLAFQDPQGFNDPCDAAAGRYEIQPGTDAFVAYFRQLGGFTVDSTSELRVDGHRAVRLVVHANADAGCPSGGRIEWQPKLDPGGSSWFLLPGDTDSLVIVELPGSTLMFEVLPAPNPIEDEVIGSIRFLDQLPTPP